MTDGQHRHDFAWSLDIIMAVRVRDTRERLGFTHAQLADMIDIPVQEMIDLEIGKTTLTPGRLYTIAQALGVPVGWFFHEVN